MQQILIVKTSALGDIIHVFPTLAYLKEQYPEVAIDWVVEKPFADLVRSHPAIRNVFCVDTKIWRRRFFQPSHLKEIALYRQAVREHYYDVAFDFQGNLKSGLLLAPTRAKIKVGFGKKTAPEWPNILFTNRRYDPPTGRNIREDYLCLAKSFSSDQTPYEDRGVHLNLSKEQQERLDLLLSQLSAMPGNKVMVCPGANWPNKRLPLDTLREFLQLLHNSYGYTFAFAWGSEQEHLDACRLYESFPGHSCVMPKLPFPLLQNLMGHMDLIVAMDSLPLHLGATTPTPTFSVFGPSSATKYQPQGSRHHAI